ncbi:ATP-binding protein [Haliangium ochraceum]|uniref:histidine kinase n=1 Tax=Haliangium ochraceum (strain DSM 14365 / JCM 11303 / SMP-2) TaxID=502025 RepID=D0LIJ1_HALO1|nr:ATP-binding protein [Haliangium ochraceum]ACY18347.1 histidine kinase [Haliangium ochraceum DSM 14365]
MRSVPALVELAERYAAMGLSAAARGAFLRALAESPEDPTAGQRLSELCLATGDGPAAARYAKALVTHHPSAESRVLLGRAQLAVREFQAARFAFGTALEARPSAEARIHAHLGLSSVALAERDRTGAGAHAMAALDSVIELLEAQQRAAAAAAESAGDESAAAASADAESAGAASPDTVSEDDERPPLALLDTVLGRVVETGRTDDANACLDELDERAPAPAALLRALLLSARHAYGDNGAGEFELDRMLSRALELLQPSGAHGESPSDARGRDQAEDASDEDTGQTLAAEPARNAAAGQPPRGPRPGRQLARALQLRLVERLLGRRQQDPVCRTQAVAQLERLAEELRAEPPSPVRARTLARVAVLLAAAREEEPGGAERAEALYRESLALQPGHPAVANRLAAIALGRGDGDAALREISRALSMDADHDWSWRTAARTLEVSSRGPRPEQRIACLLDAATPGAGLAASASARLMAAAADIARDDMLAGMYARGHRVKNLLGIIGARTRSARKLADGTVAARLSDLEREVTSLYDEWSAYLRSMRQGGTTVELIPTASILGEVVEAASARTSVPIALDLPAGLSDLRGDRLLLREALLNIISNAAEASENNDGRVDVSARVASSGAAQAVEIEVADTGPGIPLADLGRVFAPGYTTKESGSGIGLAIAERVVSAHYGRIRIDSEPGRGTRMTVVLPCDLGGFSHLAALVRLGGDGV